MIIGDRLRLLRGRKNLSQGDIEKQTGLLRCYISRVENGHTVPAIETLEKWAHALGMPLYQVLSDGEEPPEPPKISTKAEEKLWGDSGPSALQLNRLRRYLAKMDKKRAEVTALNGRSDGTRLQDEINSYPLPLHNLIPGLSMFKRNCVVSRLISTQNLSS